MKRIGMVLFAVLLCGVAAVAIAAGDAAKGEELAKGCACHKSKADLDGKDATALLEKMQAYKDGKGDNKAMIAIMKKHSDQDMADLSAYFASLPKK
jgi:cytochrome c553